MSILEEMKLMEIVGIKDLQLNNLWLNTTFHLTMICRYTIEKDKNLYGSNLTKTNHSFTGLTATLQLMVTTLCIGGEEVIHWIK